MNLIGKKVTITTRDSIYFGEWGTIIDFDGEYYYVAISDDKTSVPVFDRTEFKVRRK